MSATPKWDAFLRRFIPSSAARRVVMRRLSRRGEFDQHSAADKGIRPRRSALMEPLPISEEARALIIEKIEQACDGRNYVTVYDVTTAFEVPLEVFLDHVDSYRIGAIPSQIRNIASLLVCYAGRLEPEAFDHLLETEFGEFLGKLREKYGSEYDVKPRSDGRGEEL